MDRRQWDRRQPDRRQPDRRDRSGARNQTVAALFAVALSVVATGSAALAAEPRKDGADMPAASGRYMMTPVDGGFLRMDTDNGVVSHCAKKSAGWSCETVTDDYRALQQENEALRREMTQMRRDGTGGGTDAKAERKLELPSEEDIDKAIGKFDKYIRKFKDLIEKYQNPEAPGRT
jgi:hypothetical protein